MPAARAEERQGAAGRGAGRLTDPNLRAAVAQLAARAGRCGEDARSGIWSVGWRSSGAYLLGAIGVVYDLTMRVAACSTLQIGCKPELRLNI